MELSGKLAIVTGASRGIGRALAKELAKHGCGLLLTALEGDELHSLSDELRTYSVRVADRAADLSKPESRENFIRWVLERNEFPNILVNNAGMGGDFGRFEDQDLNNIEKTIVLNISAFVHLTHELIPLLKRRPGAKIVNISSGIARLPYPGLAIYGATKGFVSSFSESLSCELAGTNIHVLCFHPGFTMTPFMESSRMDMRKIPHRFMHPPEYVATRIVQAIQKDSAWDYSDFATGLLARTGALIPHRLKTSLFKRLFWEVPSGK